MMDQQMNRRELLAAAAVAATAACLGCLGSAATALGDDATTQPVQEDVGTVADYPADGITPTWLKTDHIAVIRHSGRIYACTSVCTHKGGILKTPDGVSFLCPRHHATFDIDGNVTKGPAKLPLNRFAISVNPAGHIIVDTSQQFTPDQWDNPASFIKVS
jgi:nitrite reductase/ring-hydroxylating ferredoxin subunit